VFLLSVAFYWLGQNALAYNATELNTAAISFMIQCHSQVEKACQGQNTKSKLFWLFDDGQEKKFYIVETWWRSQTRTLRSVWTSPAWPPSSTPPPPSRTRAPTQNIRPLQTSTQAIVFGWGIAGGMKAKMRQHESFLVRVLNFKLGLCTA